MGSSKKRRISRREKGQRVSTDETQATQDGRTGKLSIETRDSRKGEVGKRSIITVGAENVCGPGELRRGRYVIKKKEKSERGGPRMSKSAHGKKSAKATQRRTNDVAYLQLMQKNSKGSCIRALPSPRTSGRMTMGKGKLALGKRQKIAWLTTSEKQWVKPVGPQEGLRS